MGVLEHQLDALDKRESQEAVCWCSGSIPVSVHKGEVHPRQVVMGLRYRDEIHMASLE